MQEAAWRYGHKKQVLMDLTFGVCSACALLIILMAIDKTGSGVPICFMLGELATPLYLLLCKML